MLRRILIIGAVVMFIAAAAYLFYGGSPKSEKAGKRLYNIGIIDPDPPLKPAADGLRDRLKELGYREGVDVSYVVIPAGKSVAETETQITAALSSPLDLIFSSGIINARAAKNVTASSAPDLPVIFAVVSNPVENKLVASLASSGNNITGVSPNNDLIVGKRIELFRNLFPGLRRVIFLWNDPITTGVGEVRSVASALGLALVERRVANAKEIDEFLASFTPAKGDGFVRATDAVNAQRAAQFLQWALDHRVPLSGTNVGDTEKGAFMSYGANYYNLGRQAAVLAHKILREGKKPSDLPIEPPAALELTLNKKTAALLGVDISSEQASVVDRIIED
ncbi:MAG: ABC transporter substrate-binding protein [Patescibacteria group bacterium]